MLDHKRLKKKKKKRKKTLYPRVEICPILIGIQLEVRIIGCLNFWHSSCKWDPHGLFLVKGHFGGSNENRGLVIVRLKGSFVVF